MTRTSTPHTPRAPRLQITVTQAIIDEAIPKDSGHCMIAEAVKAALPGSRKHAVDVQTIRLTDPKRQLRYTYLTPRIGQEALVRWDAGIKPAPFSFILRNGQVTRGHALRHAGPKKELNPEQLAQRRTNAEKMVALNKARLSKKQSEASTSREIPDRIGGKTPPLSRDKHNIPYSRRREFGVRALSI